MHNTSLGMAAFARQVQFMTGAVAGKANTSLKQPLNRIGGSRGNEFDGGAITQACSGNQRVFNVSINAVAGGHDGGNAALGVLTGTLVQRPFGKQQNADASIRQTQCRA
jgi:hypothetical protein